MKTKHLSLGITLLALVSTAYSQEFVTTQAQSQSQMQASNPPGCQENCAETQANSGQNGGQSGLQIDRSGMDKASIHLQVLQQTSQKFTEPSNSKKNNNDDKKSTTKNQTQD